MGLREKVTITLVIIALIQIACRHCMPRTPRKASLKRYLNDLKPVKNNPVPTPKSPSRLNKTPKQTFGKTSQNGRISQNSIPKKSLYQTYKFPEIEYPLDNSPRDPFHVEMNFYDNNHVSTLQKAHNLQSTAIKDLKKEMKMKRKLLSNKQMNKENNPLKTEMSSIKFASYPDEHLLDSESFPEVQYPLNTMDTWGPNYRSYLPFTQENLFNKFGHQLLNRQAKEDINKPFTRLTKAKASKYLQSYDKLKEEQRRTSTENSKRSNAGQKGLNFTKTATCEKISDDFMTAGLVSNIPTNSTGTKKTLEPSIEIKASSENTCPVTENPNHSVPIPHRVIENNTENMSALEQKNNTKELQDMDTSVIAQTLQLIEEILFHDDTSSAVSTRNYSEDIENNVDSSNCTDLKTSDENEYISTTLMQKNCTDSLAEELSRNYSEDIENNVDSSNCTDLKTSEENEYISTTLMQKNCTDSLAEELSIEALDDAPADIIPSPPEMISAENNSTFEGPLNVRMPLPFSEPGFEAVTNASEQGLTNMVPIANSNTVPSSTSIIIIPINKDSDGKSLSHILETSTGTPIIVYLPSTQNSYIPSQTQNQIVSSSVDNSVPNNELYNLISNMAPLQNDNPPSTALVSDLLNSISDSGSSLPMYETLPTNSMCYNNESSPSSMKEKPVSDILSLIDDAPLRKTICNEKLPEQPTETDNFVINPETLPPTPDFEHPLFDFGDSELSSLSHGPYNNVLKNELPILEREINSYQQISNVATKDLFVSTQNVTSQYLQKNISKDYFSEITNNASIVALDQNFTFETPTESVLEPIIIEEMPPTPCTDITAEQPLPISTSRSLTPLTETLSNNLSGIMDIKLSATPNTTTDSAPKQIVRLGNILSPTATANNSPMTTDISIKTELYKIRQILDKMLSSGTPTDSQITPMDAILSPISDTERVTMLVNESLEPTQTLIDSDSVSLPFYIDNTLTPILASDTSIDSSRLQEHETLLHDLVDGTSSDTLLLPGEASRIPSFLFDKLDTPLPLIVDTVPSTPVFEHPAENKPYLIDNLVTPLSDELLTKMDLVIPNIYELPCNGLPLPVEDLPIMVHEEPITNPKSEDATNNLPTQVIEPQNSHSNVQVSDLLHINKQLSIPEVLEATLPDISSESQTTTMGGYKNKIQQDFSPSTILDSSEVERKPKVNLPLSFIPDVSPDAFMSINAKIEDFPHTSTDTKDLISVEDHLLLLEDDAHPDTVVTNSHSAVSLPTKLEKTNDEELSEYILSDSPRDDLILTDEILPLTNNTSTDLPLPINKTPTTSKLSIAMALLQNVLSDITKEGLSSSVTKPVPITPSSIWDKTKYQVDFESQLLEAIEIPPAEKVFHKSDASTNLTNPEKPEDILPLQVDNAPSVTPNLDIPTKDLPFKMDEVCTGLSPDIQTDEIDKCFSPQERTETLPLDNPDDVLLPTDKVPLPHNTLNRNSLLNKNTISASKLQIPKALLENVLSDVSTKGFSLTAASKAFAVKPPSVLDKTTFYLESPLSDLIEEISSPSEIPPVNENISSTTHSDQPTENNLPFSGQSADTLPWKVDKTLAEISSLHIPSEMLNNKALPKSDVDMISPKAEILPKEIPSDLPSSNTKVLSSSKLPIAKSILQNVLSDVTSESFSLPVSKVLPVKSSSLIDKTFYYLESPLSDRTEVSNLSSVNEMISSTTLPDQPGDNNLPFAGKSIENVPLEKDKTFLTISSFDIPSEISSLDIPLEIASPMEKSVVDISSPKAEILPTDTQSDLPLSNSKTLSSSKLPITKALLQNIVSDVTSKSFSLPVSKVLPVKSSSLIDKTLYNIESPLSDRTEVSNLSSVNEMISSTTLPDQPGDNNLPFAGKSKENMPLEKDKTFLAISSFEIPSEISSFENTSEISCLDIPSEITSPMEKSVVDISSPKAEILPTDTQSDLPLSNSKTLSSSKLPINKALLQNVLSDVTSKSFSLPISKVLPVKSSSLIDKTLYNIESPLSDRTEVNNLSSVNEMISSTTLPDQPGDNNLPFAGNSKENVPLEKDKTFLAISSFEIPSEISSFEIPSEISSFDIPSEISSLDIPSEITSPMEKSVVDISSPKAEILPTDTQSDLPLSNSKTLSSSKLPITKALLQNIVSDVTSKSFSLPVSKVLPVKSSSLIDKTLYNIESPLSDRTEVSNLSSVNEMISSTTLPDQPGDNNLPFAGKSKENMPLEKDKTFLAISSFEIPSEISSFENTSEISCLDIPSEITSPMEKSVVDISSPKAEILPTDTQSDLPLSNSKTLSSSKLPINKALLQNVLSDVTSKSFSLPISKVLPVKSSSLIDKTLYNIESPLSDRTEVNNLSSVNEMISSTTLPDQPGDNNLPFAGNSKENVPLEKDKTFLAISSFEIPSEISSFDIPSEISSLDIPSEITSPMEKSVVDISSPKAEILPTDTQSDLPLSNSKTLSSSKLPITKALLQNVLSDVTSKSFSLPISKVLPVKSSSLIDKTLYNIESPLSDRTEVNNLSSVNEMISSTTLPDQPGDNNLPFAGNSKENVPLEKDKTFLAISSFEIPSEISSFEIPSEISSFENTSEISSLDIPSEITSPMEKSVVDISSPKAEILPTDTQSDLPLSNSKTLSSSKLPIAKALLQNVLSDVTSKSFSLPISKVIPVKSSSLIDKTLNNIKSPLSDRTEVNNLSSVNEMISSTTLPDQPGDNNLPFAGKSKENVPLEKDKTFLAISSFEIPSEISSFEIPSEISSFEIPSEISSLDIPSEITSPMEKSVVDISSPKAEILPTDTQSDLPLANSKTLSSSKLPIAKALLQNIMSDVTSKSFSLPVSKVLPVKSSSLIDKTLYNIESPLSDRTEVNEMISSTTLPDQPGDNNLPFAGKSKENVPLEKDKTFLAISSFEIPSEISSFENTSEISSLDIPSEITSPMEKSVVDISSPKADILPTDTQSDLPLSNSKTLSSSKLPIAKALLQNVLSDVTSKSFSLPVSKVLPVKSSFVMDKTLYNIESPLSDRTEVSNLSSVNEMISSTTLPDQPGDNNLPLAGKSKEIVPLEKDKTFLTISSLENPSEISSFEIPSEITSPMEKSVVDISSPEAEILPTDTQSDLPLSNSKTLSSSKLPIAKALLQNIMSDVTSKSFSLPVSKVLPVKSSFVMDKTLYNIESPLSDRTEVSNLSSVNEMISSTLPDQPVDNNLPFAGKSKENVPLEKDKTFLAISSFDIPSEISSLDIPSEITSPVEKSIVNILSTKAEILPTDTQSDLPLSNSKTLSSSKLPITKALLQNIVSDVTSKSFSLPVSKVLPVKSSSLIDKTLYNIESPLSDRTEVSNLSSVNEMISSTTVPDQPDDNNLPFAGKSKENVPLGKDKTFLAISSLDIPSEITSQMEKSVVNISSPKAEILPTDTQSDLPLANSKTLSSSKLPIAKALLQNVLSDVTSKSFSLPISKVLPVKSSSLIDKTLYNIESPLSDRTEVNNLSSVNEMISSTTLPDQPGDNNLPFAGKSKENVPLGKDKTFLAISSLDIPSEITSQMEKSVVNISSPKAEILPTDTQSDLPLANSKTLSSSKLPIAKALLQNVLSDVTSKSFSLPVSKVLPVKSSFVMDKTLYNIESPLSDRTEVSNLSSVNEMISSTTLPDQPSDNNLPFAGKSKENVPLKKDKTFLAISSFDIPSEISSLDIPSEITSPMEKSVVDISSPKAEILPTDTQSDLPLANSKTLSSSKLPIAKALLQNVLSDVTSKSFSLPISKVLPVKSSSLIDKTLYNIESPLSDRTEVNNLSSVNEMISSTTLPDQPGDNNLPFAGKSKENVPLEKDKTFLAISSFEIPSEISSFGNTSEISSLDIPSEITSPMEKSVVDISSPKADILPTDTQSDLPLSNSKTLSSSKLPIAKALLQNVLSDVTSKSFSLPVSKVLPVKSSFVMDKTLHNIESPLSDRTEVSNLSSVNEMISSTTLPDQPGDNNLPLAGKSKEIVLLEKDKTFLTISSLENPSEISSFEIPSEITSPMEKSVVDISSPKAEILPTDTQSDLPLSNAKTLSSSKLPITKALLQNVLSDVTSKSFSLPVSKVLPVKYSSLIDKTLYNIESPLSDRTEVNNLSSVNEMISSTTLPDQPSDNNLPFAGKSKENVPLKKDKTFLAISSFDIPSEISSLDIPSEITSPMEKSFVDISSPKTEILPTDTQSDLPLSNSKTLSSSKLPITKALLENVLSDVTTKDVSLPVVKVLQVKLSPVLDKTLYKESPHSDLTEESPFPSINKIISSTTLPDQPTEPLSEKHEDTLPPEVDKTLSEVSSLDIPPEMSLSLTDQLLSKSNVDITSPKAAILPKDTPSELPLSLYTKTLPSSKLPIVKTLLQNVLSDVTSKGFSLPVSKALPVKSSSVLDETLYYEASPLSDPTERSPLSSVNNIISSKTHPHQPADNNYISEQSEETLPLEVDKMLSEVSSLDIPSEMSSLMSNVDITLPKAEIIPEDTPSDIPLLNTKALSSSKLSITKAILENVLSEINTKEFSLPEATSPPVELRSQLDKTLYYMESPHSDRIKESSQDKFSSSEINDDVFDLSLEKIFSDHPNLNNLNTTYQLTKYPKTDQTI